MSLDGIRRGQSGFVVLNNEGLPRVGEGLAAGAFLFVHPILNHLLHQQGTIRWQTLLNRRSAQAKQNIFKVKNTSRERTPLQLARHRILVRKRARRVQNGRNTVKIR